MPNFLQKIVSLLRAVLSGRDYKLQAERDEICNGCDQFTENPVKNIWGRWKMTAHCKSCGCGARSIADIHKGKHAWRDMKCPLLKWPGDAEDRGLSLRDANALFVARDRLEYNMATVQNLIDKGKPMEPAMLSQIYGHQPAQAPPNPAGKAPAGAANVAHAQPRAVPADRFNEAFGSKRAEPRDNVAAQIATGRAALATAQAQNDNGDGI